MPESQASAATEFDAAAGEALALPAARQSAPIAVRAIDIARFAYTIGATDPRHYGTSGQVAVAPNGFHVTLSKALDPPAPGADRSADGRFAHVHGSTRSRSLAAGTEVEFLAPIVAGEVITITEMLVSSISKVTRAGAGEFTTWERLFSAADGTPLVRERHTAFLHDGPGEEQR
jgi:hypothetical protein